MSMIVEYVKPELVVVAFVLYYIGTFVKQTESIKDKYIPCILGVLGVVFCLIWVLGNSNIGNYQDALNGAFTAVVQGVLIAGLSTYGDQLIKQHKKDE